MEGLKLAADFVFARREDRQEALKAKKEVKNMDEYFGSKEYIEDCKRFVKNNPNKTIFGGYTKDGYTRYTLPNGETVSAPVSSK